MGDMKALKWATRAISAILLFVPFLIRTIYRMGQSKSWYITGTFKNGDDRAFFRTILTTPGNILPIKSIEKSVSDEFGGKDVVVLFFQHIPKRMIDFVEKENGVNIDVKDKL